PLPARTAGPGRQGLPPAAPDGSCPGHPPSVRPAEPAPATLPGPAHAAAGDPRELAARAARARSSPDPGTSSGASRMTVTHLVHKRKAVPHTETRWRGRNYPPRGKLTLIDGDPGLGKSFLSLDVAARVTKGRPFPVNPEPAEPGRVLLVSCEDSLSDVIAPRLL